VTIISTISVQLTIALEHTFIFGQRYLRYVSARDHTMIRVTVYNMGKSLLALIRMLTMGYSIPGLANIFEGA
jgi:hypothetical protein